MEALTVKSPQCGSMFELSDALTGNVKERLAEEMRREIREQERNSVSKEVDSLKEEIKKASTFENHVIREFDKNNLI